jgi:hypothetical protein
VVKFVTGGTAEFNLLAFGEPSPTTLSFIEERANYISHNLTDTARALFEGSKQVFESIHGSEAMRKARAALRTVTGLFQQDQIRMLWHVPELQNASLIMQRWLMAEETMRRAYHAQQCDGYHGSYVDMNPGMVGRDHYDYRLIYDGVVISTEEEPFKVTHYFDDILEGDRKLRPEEKIDIMISHDAIRAAFAAGGSDPSSILNDNL